jgi:hypothetical protein
MSIFKESFKPEIRDQLEARQSAIFKRDFTSIKYLNSRAAWIKMTSSVNVNGSSDIANKYVLLGGTLINGKLKSGVGTGQEYVYNSDSGNNRLGIRPMPGITGVDIKSKSAYGSLLEATINFVCWDIKQLEELELLYMRPNYSVLLEWGWAPYLKGKKDAYGIEYNPSANFNTSILAGGVSKEDVWKETYNKALSTGGNYGAIYGFVKNYSWSARPDGGYDCTTTLITMGELIESIKVNFGVNTTNLAFTQGTFKLANIDYFKQDGPLNKAYSRNYLAGLLYEMWVIMKEGNEIKSKQWKSVKFGDIPLVRFYCYEFKSSGAAPTAPAGGESDDETFVSDPINIYIKLEDFIKLFNRYCLLQDSKHKKPLVEVSIKEGYQHNTEGADLLCLGHPFQISMDPTICLIKNSQFAESLKSVSIAATISTTTTTSDQVAANIDDVEASSDAANTAKEVISGLPESEEFIKDKKNNYGYIKNIYVNLAYLYTLITDDALASQDKKEKKEISAFDYLKNMISGINSSIGNVANFEIHVDPTDSIARIVDINYVDERNKNEAFDNAFLLEVHNLKSTVRSYKLESQIFPEQSATVAIGAQAKGGSLGTGDNTLVDFNQNLTDRIIPAKDISDLIQPTDTSDGDKLNNLKQNLNTIAEYFSSLDDGNSFTRFFGGGATFDKNKASQYTGALRDIIVYTKTLTADTSNNRAIIPTKLSIEMDGIGGIIIGSMFKIPDDILPRGYKGIDGIGAKIAYLVTSMGHSIQNNDWKTSLGAQFIILDGMEKKNAGFKSITDAIAAKVIAIDRVKKIIQSSESDTNNTNNTNNTPSKDLKDLSTPVSKVPHTVDQIIAALNKKGYRHFKDPWVLNIVSVRNGYKQQGAVVTDNFIDSIYMWYYDNTGKRTDATALNTTTPAKVFYTGAVKDNFNSMVPNQYKDAYIIGNHISYRALVENIRLKIVRQSTTGKYDYSITQDDYPGDNIHRALQSGKTGVMTTRYVKTGETTGWSRGCQVFQNVDDFKWMMAAANQQVTNTTRKVFDYTLLNESDVTGVVPAPPPPPSPPSKLNHIGVALQLFDALDKVNTDEANIYAQLNRLNNQVDWTEVIKAYGTRETTAGINYKGRLKNTLNEKLDSDELKKVKEILAKKGITY